MVLLAASLTTQEGAGSLAVRAKRVADLRPLVRPHLADGEPLEVVHLAALHPIGDDRQPRCGRRSTDDHPTQLTGVLLGRGWVCSQTVPGGRLLDRRGLSPPISTNIADDSGKCPLAFGTMRNRLGLDRRVSAVFPGTTGPSEPRGRAPDLAPCAERRRPRLLGSAGGGTNRRLFPRAPRGRRRSLYDLLHGIQTIPPRATGTVPARDLRARRFAGQGGAATGGQTGQAG